MGKWTFDSRRVIIFYEDLFERSFALFKVNRIVVFGTKNSDDNDEGDYDTDEYLKDIVTMPFDEFRNRIPS